MLRIKSNCLTTKDDTCYYAGEPFTGVAFELREGVVISMTNYREGLPSGDYVNEYLPEMDNLLHVDESCLEEDETHYTGEPFSYRGTPFTGISYEFMNDCCVAEQLYKNGILDSDVCYYQSGQLEEIDVLENGFSQNFVWDKEGNVVKIRLFQRDFLEFSIEFNAGGQLDKLVLDGRDCFERIGAVKERLYFPVYEDKSFFRELSGGERLYLSGESIDDELLENLIYNAGLEQTEVLFIYRSSITEKGLIAVKAVNKLKELRVKSADKELLSTLKELKRSLSELTILFNDENV